MSFDAPDKLGVASYDFRLVFGCTRIDYCRDKEQKNRRKHNYSLESAVFLLERLLLPTGEHVPFVTKGPYEEGGEVRHMHMTVDEGKVVLMVTTMRENETVRVISFRRAEKKERELFRELTGYGEK